MIIWRKKLLIKEVLTDLMAEKNRKYNYPNIFFFSVSVIYIPDNLKVCKPK
jgi:hypothetical protein